MKRSVLIFSVVAIIVLLSTVVFVNLRKTQAESATNNSALDFAELQAQYTGLKEMFNALQANYSALQTEYRNLLGNQTGDSDDPDDVPNPAVPDWSNSQYAAQQKAYAELQEKFNNFTTEYRKIRDQFEMRLLRSNAGVFITPSNPEVASIVYNITGGKWNSSTSGNFWGDIKALNDWVTKNIDYRADGLFPAIGWEPWDVVNYTDQMAQFSNETLSIRKGDCEDLAILLVSMIRSYTDNQYAAEAIWVTSSTSGHVAVQIPISGDKFVILDPTRGYSSSDAFGNISPGDISTELYNWMNLWRPTVGSDIRVYRVFSDYMDMNFNSTSEYIDWMAAR